MHKMQTWPEPWPARGSAASADRCVAVVFNDSETYVKNAVVTHVTERSGFCYIREWGLRGTCEWELGGVSPGADSGTVSDWIRHTVNRNPDALLPAYHLFFVPACARFLRPVERGGRPLDVLLDKEQPGGSTLRSGVMFITDPLSGSVISIDMAESLPTVLHRMDDYKPVPSTQLDVFRKEDDAPSTYFRRLALTIRNKKEVPKKFIEKVLRSKQCISESGFVIAEALKFCSERAALGYAGTGAHPADREALQELASMMSPVLLYLASTTLRAVLLPSLHRVVKLRWRQLLGTT
jgi:hypothetical protein